jgi:hypothetical protein
VTVPSKWSSNWLVVYLFVLSLASSLWIAADATRWLAWAAVLALAIAITRYPFVLDAPIAGVRPSLRDLVAAILIALPTAVNLALTWRQEFPTSGDQFMHNGLALEAYAFWFPLAWLAAVTAIGVVVAAVRRNPESRLPLLALAALALLALIGFRGGFAVQYPALLHFFSIPCRALIPAQSPLDVERLVNALSIPAWLLLLRPRLLGRHVDVAALIAGLFLFWQKDVVYYFSSGYLEPWAIVLLLTAGEHLLRFQSEMLWRPLLLLGTAAMLKDHTILTLPVVAAVFLPRRRLWPYLATCAAAAAPFAIFAARGDAHLWQARGFLSLHDALGAHAALWRERIALQFEFALPLLAIALAALLLLALRNRGAVALALAAAADAGFFFFAARVRLWAGYPRTNLVPLAFAALALGFIIERVRRPVVAAAMMAVIVAANSASLLPMLARDFAPSDARNFFEHSDAPIYFPIREALAHSSLVTPSTTVEVLNNGKWLWPRFYPGYFEETYPDLAARFHMRVESFRSMPQRCACTGSSVKFAVFVRFTGLGTNIPVRRTMEAEAAQCRAAMEATCTRRETIIHGGTIVGLLGR